MNIRMKTSDVFKDGEVPEDAEDPDAAAEALKFPWHCEKGILENIRKLNDEFNAARGLNPVKIMITGPPASGKSFYADKLAHYYNIPRVHVLELIEKAFKLAEAETEDEESFGAQIKAKIEEIKDEMVAKIEENRPETDEEPEEVDRDSLVVRLPDDILFKLLQERLNENACRNRGYVLDGFPRSYNNAQFIFLKWEITQDEDGNDVEQPELGEDEV
jgi:adenylate kinase